MCSLLARQRVGGDQRDMCTPRGPGCISGSRCIIETLPSTACTPRVELRGKNTALVPSPACTHIHTIHVVALFSWNSTLFRMCPSGSRRIIETLPPAACTPAIHAPPSRRTFSSEGKEGSLPRSAQLLQRSKAFGRQFPHKAVNIARLPNKSTFNIAKIEGRIDYV